MEVIDADRAARALDALEETLNVIFLHTGAVFEGAASPDGNRIASNNARMGDFIPKALRQFEDSLLELEAQVTQAQQAFRRDLVLSRMKPGDLAMSTPPPLADGLATEAAATASAPAPEPAPAPASASAPAPAASMASADGAADSQPARADSKPEQPTVDTASARDGPAAAAADNLQSANSLFDFDSAGDAEANKASAAEATSEVPAKSEETKDAVKDGQQPPALDSQQDAASNAGKLNLADTVDMDAFLPGVSEYANDDSLNDLGGLGNIDGFDLPGGDGDLNFDPSSQDGFNFGNYGDLDSFDFGDAGTNANDNNTGNQDFDESFFNL